MSTDLKKALYNKDEHEPLTAKEQAEFDNIEPWLRPTTSTKIVKKVKKIARRFKRFESSKVKREVLLYKHIAENPIPWEEAKKRIMKAQ